MTGLNPLKVKVLITTDEVIFHGPTDNKVDPRILLQSIIVAETRFIVPMIGLIPYTALVNAKNKVVTEINKDELQTALNAGRNAKDVIEVQLGDYVNSDTYLSTAQQALWQNHLHKLVAECVVYTALPGNRARFTNQGVTKNSPDIIGGTGSVASVDLFELKHLMDRTLQHRIGPLMDAMHDYLCQTVYPGYTNKYTATKRSGISLEMYDDEDDKCRCTW
jgi:hypothetical protein